MRKTKTDRNSASKKTNYDICCESVESMAQLIDIAKIGWTKEQMVEWLKREATADSLSFTPGVETHTKQITNKQRIQSMSDEELTRVLLCPYDTAGEEIDIMPCMKDGRTSMATQEECRKCIIEWLHKTTVCGITR